MKNVLDEFKLEFEDIRPDCWHMEMLSRTERFLKRAGLLRARLAGWVVTL